MRLDFPEHNRLSMKLEIDFAYILIFWSNAAMLIQQ